MRTSLVSPCTSSVGVSEEATRKCWVVSSALVTSALVKWAVSAGVGMPRPAAPSAYPAGRAAKGFLASGTAETGELGLSATRLTVSWFPVGCALSRRGELTPKYTAAANAIATSSSRATACRGSEPNGPSQTRGRTARP